jgi:hypothetical protein
MMGSTNENALARAFQLIEEDQLVEAREIIQSVLVDDSENPDAWWIYAHAVEDPNEARRALNRVADIDPAYPGLAELLAFYADSSSMDLEDEDTFGDFDSLDDTDFDELEDDESDSRPWLRRLVILAVILLLAFIGLLILGGGLGRQSSDPIATDVAQQPTNEPLVFLPPEDGNQPTEETSSTNDEDSNEEITAEPQTVSVLSAIFEDYQLADDTLESTVTQLGTTQVVLLCVGQDFSSLRDMVQTGLLRLSENLDIIDLDTEAIAVRVDDCEANEPLLFIGSTVDDAALFADGELSTAEFVGQWTALD